VASIDSGRKMTWSRLDRDGVGEAGRRGLGCACGERSRPALVSCRKREKTGRGWAVWHQKEIGNGPDRVFLFRF
jgi:hypothetical protein